MVMNSQMLALATELADEYDLSAEFEGEHTIEFFEGDQPLFTVLLGKDATGEIHTYLTFHVDLDAPGCILWYLRVRQTCPDIRVTNSYMRDAKGEALFGQAAFILKEKKIYDSAVASVKKKLEIANDPPVEGAAERELKRKKQALKDFEIWNPKKTTKPS